VTIWLAVVGWAMASALALQAARLARRLELVAQADHELRGPVCALALAVEALSRNPELRRRAAALDVHLDRLRLGLADLGAAREGRRVAGGAGEVRIDSLARAAAEAWEPAVRAGGGEISFDWRAGPAVAHADPARLSQALGNLLANAVEHGGERIAVVGERQGEGVRIAVRDSGRTRGSPRADARGRGRGLAIAAHAVADVRGSLAVPDLVGVLPGRSRRSRRRAISAEPAIRPRLAASLRPATGDGSPTQGTEIRIELPVVRAPDGSDG